MTKRRQLQAERLALYLARPDVGRLLSDAMEMESEAGQLLGYILAAAKAVAGRIELAGPHPDEPPADRYRLLLEELREDMRLRIDTDLLNFHARVVREDVIVWITAKLDGKPTVADAARALLGKDATLEVVDGPAVCTCEPALGQRREIHRSDCALAVQT